MRLKSKRHDPSEGWVFTTDQNVVIKEQLFDLLLHSAIQHFTCNGRFGTKEGLNDKGLVIFTRDTLIVAIEQQICENSPPGSCEDDIRPLQERITIERAVAASRQLISLLQGKTIPIESATSRAAICVNCKNNSTIWKGCFSCNAARSLVSHFFKKKTTLDQHLKMCTVCGCVLGAKIFVTAEAIRKFSIEKAGKYPDGCWVKDVLQGKDI